MGVTADDDRLPEFGYGITNLVARPTPGIDTLLPSEYVEGWKVLDRKIRRFKPAVVALVGVTLWRAIVPLLCVTGPCEGRLNGRRYSTGTKPSPSSFPRMPVWISKRKP